jgi:hypothetical protein
MRVGIIPLPSEVDSFCGLVGRITVGDSLKAGIQDPCQEVAMSNDKICEVQLCLFPAKLVWHEFPQDVRRQVSQLLVAMCVEIIEDFPTPEQETQDESRSHSPLAP